MEPWYKVVSPRKEVREGRSFNPDEFAIHPEQVVAGTAPEDYREPGPVFARTCFTRALREHPGLVLRRLAGRTENAAPVLTLITQFGGGKTHTLTALYHLARSGPKAAAFNGAFIQNLTVATTGTTRGAAVISLPRSQVEMTDWDLQWQERITKVVRRVAKDLIANDEAEISEVLRRRLFEDLGSERVRKNVARSRSPSGLGSGGLPPGSTRARSSGASASRAATCGTRSRTGWPGGGSRRNWSGANWAASTTGPR
jgi:hypothetical protein